MEELILITIEYFFLISVPKKDVVEFGLVLRSDPIIKPKHLQQKLIRPSNAETLKLTLTLSLLSFFAWSKEHN